MLNTPRVILNSIIPSCCVADTWCRILGAQSCLFWILCVFCSLWGCSRSFSSVNVPMPACKGWWWVQGYYPSFSWNLWIPSLSRCRSSFYLRKFALFILSFWMLCDFCHQACTARPWYSFLHCQFYFLLLLVWIFSFETVLGFSALPLFYSAHYFYIPFCCFIHSLKCSVSSLTSILLSASSLWLLFPMWVYIRKGSGYDWWKSNSKQFKDKWEICWVT